MAEYIERKKAISYINSMPRAGEYPETMLVEAVHGALLIVPAADVAPVRHGRWEIYLGGKELMCSACKTTFWDEDGSGGSNYCPNCGGKMNGVKNDENANT